MVDPAPLLDGSELPLGLVAALPLLVVAGDDELEELATVFGLAAALWALSGELALFELSAALFELLVVLVEVPVLSDEFELLELSGVLVVSGDTAPVEEAASPEDDEEFAVAEDESEDPEDAWLAFPFPFPLPTPPFPLAEAPKAEPPNDSTAAAARAAEPPQTDFFISAPAL